MKELHNHIFSNTTCISKETMLRYINKQLAKDELYEVERHMLDCELCSDAYEGMNFAQNSSILFAIDNQIDQRVGGGNSKAPVMRNLMVAASILVIVFGAYFTFDFFNSTIDNEKELAINEVEDLEEEMTPVEEKTKAGEVEVNVQQNTGKDNINVAANATVVEDNEVSGPEGSFGYRAEADIPKPVLAEQSLERSKVSYDLEDEIASEEEEIVTLNFAKESGNKAKGESEKLRESLDDSNADADNRREDDFTTVLKIESSTINNEIDNVANEPAANEVGEVLKKQEKRNNNRTRSKNSKKGKFKSNAPSPAFDRIEAAEETLDFSDRKQQKVLVMDTYKVVDYTDEYQEEYDKKNINKVDTKSISAGFESKENKDVAEKQKDELTIEVTYKETLEKAIKLYKNKKYTQAIEQFDIILKEHPDEVNGLFYGGLSNYHLQRYTKAEGKLNSVLKNKETEFNEEANWYKALTLIALKKEDKAKTVLKGIIKTNGFYKVRAEEKLKTLK